MPKGVFSVLKTNDEFIKEFKEKQPELFKSIEIIGKYTGFKNHILVKTKYGNCLSLPNSLLKGITPTIKSAVNKTKYFKNNLKAVSPKVYKSIKILGEYKTAHKHILVSNKYGNCLVEPNSLLNGFPPTIQSAVNPTEYFINKAKEVHGDLYDYSLVEYKGNQTKVKIISSEGMFEQTPNNHLSGQGCPILGKKSNYDYTTYAERGLRNKKSKSFKVYIIKCWNDTETFYKIGKTFNTVYRRYSSNVKHMPYKYKVVDKIEFKKTFEGGLECCKLEHELHLYYKDYKYKPIIDFPGSGECFYDLPIID